MVTFPPLKLQGLRFDSRSTLLLARFPTAWCLRVLKRDVSVTKRMKTCPYFLALFGGIWWSRAQRLLGKEREAQGRLGLVFGG